VPAISVKVRDVSGAGDTVVATLAALLSAGSDFESAARIANAAASIVVGKRGTAVVTPEELRSRVLPAAALAAEEKIAFDWGVADDRVREWRAQGQRVGFTNGCFDILHPGHVKVLAEARGQCDRLVVGLNGDASVARLKGEGRPIQDAHARADVLAALEAVDLVVVFDQDTPLELIRRIRPKVLIKGGDYTRDSVVGAAEVEADGGEVVIVGLLPGHSTTSIAQRSARNESGAAQPKAALRVVKD
jgi:D-beta-D-heptose 7-phosphate kinase/D-beta-D-heptose 1-phosphate adenosyltransferase